MEAVSLPADASSFMMATTQHKFWKAAPQTIATAAAAAHGGITAELHRYLADAEEPHVEGSTALHWWRVNERRYPALAKVLTMPVPALCNRRLLQVAKHYLCIQATSAAAERVFSSAGFIDHDRRANLTPTHLGMLVFLAENAAYL